MGSPDDPTAIFHNPAGIADLRGGQILMQVCGRIANFSAEMFRSDFTKTPEIAPGYVFAANPFIAYTDNFGLEDISFGIGFYVPTGIGAKMPEDEPTRYHATFAYGFGGNLTFSAAYRPSPYISFGAGISAILFLFHLEQYLNLGGYLIGMQLNNWDWRFDRSLYNTITDYRLQLDGHDFSWNFNFGILLNPLPWLSFGICYTHEADVTLKGDVLLENAMDTSIKELATHETIYFIPGHLRMGVNVVITESIEAGFDYTVNFYSRTPDQVIRLSPKGQASLMNIMKLPEEYGGGLGIVTKRDLWENHNMAAGVLYHMIQDASWAKAFDIMAGFQYDLTPYPTDSYSLLSPTRDYIGVNIGTRWLSNGGWMIGFGFGFTYGWDIYVVDSASMPPLNVDATGYLFHVLLNAVYRFNWDEDMNIE